jgi:hypothetical protein
VWFGGASWRGGVIQGRFGEWRFGLVGGCLYRLGIVGPASVRYTQSYAPRRAGGIYHSWRLSASSRFGSHGKELVPITWSSVFTLLLYVHDGADVSARQPASPLGRPDQHRAVLSRYVHHLNLVFFYPRPDTSLLRPPTPCALMFVFSFLSTSKVVGIFCTRASRSNHHHPERPELISVLLRIIVVPAKLFPWPSRNCMRISTSQPSFLLLFQLSIQQRDLYPTQQHTGIRQRNRLGIVIAHGAAQGRNNHERHGTEGTDHDGPEVARTLTGGPAAVAERGGPETGDCAAHCVVCVLVVVMTSVAAEREGWLVVGVVRSLS